MAWISRRLAGRARRTCADETIAGVVWSAKPLDPGRPRRHVAIYVIDFKRSVVSQEAEPRFDPAMFRNKPRQTSLVSIWIVEDDASLAKVDPGGLVGCHLTVVPFYEIHARVVYHTLGSSCRFTNAWAKRAGSCSMP